MVFSPRGTIEEGRYGGDEHADCYGGHGLGGCEADADEGASDCP